MSELTVEIKTCLLPNREGTKTLCYGRVKLFGALEASYTLYDGKTGPWVKLGRSFQNKEGKWKNDLYLGKGDMEVLIHGEVDKAYEKAVKTPPANMKDVLDDFDNITIEDKKAYTAEDIPF